MAVYAGEAALPAPDVHYGNLLTPTACDRTVDSLPFADLVTLRSSQVTCRECRERLDPDIAIGVRS